MSDGLIPSECIVCGYKGILRFNVCKECDDAFWITMCSKKHHTGCENHSIYDVRYIKNKMKERADRILYLETQLEDAEKIIANLVQLNWNDATVLESNTSKTAREYFDKYKKGSDDE